LNLKKEQQKPSCGYLETIRLFRKPVVVIHYDVDFQCISIAVALNHIVEIFGHIMQPCGTAGELCGKGFALCGSVIDISGRSADSRGRVIEGCGSGTDMREPLAGLSERRADMCEQ
jgi:hypothetical protein